MHVHRASRTEQLALNLLDSLRTQPPRAVLAPQRVVVAHPALGRWLLQAVALYGESTHGAGRGIAANLDFELPGQWLARLLAQLLGDAPPAAAHYAQESLRWVLYRELGTLDEPVVQRYLDVGQGQAELRRFQLAQHLAGLYTQYLVYRREWILSAERAPSTSEHWQARLWRATVARLGPGHRAQRMDAVLRGLGDGAALQIDQPLHLFGINHLPPDLLLLLQRLARRQAVHLYVTDPAPQVYWHDQPSGRALARLPDSADRGHPLLAALGGLGKQFLRQLDQLDARDVALDEAQESLAPLLARVQQGLRDVLPTLVGPALKSEAEFKAARADASLRIHACHTPLRELEVLRDALLDLLVKHPQIHPRDIVVMAPDISVYAALIPAVFGAPGRDAQGQIRALPWQLADRTLLSLHPLLSGFPALLDLPRSRITHSEVLAALELSAVQRALGLDADGVDTLQRWLGRTRVAWGLDGAMKAELGAAEQDAHSFAHALDQLYLGLLSGGDEALAGFAGMAPLEGVSDLQAPLLGALQSLLDLLSEARTRMAGSYTLSEWIAWLSGWTARLLKADPTDSAETEAMATLHGVLQAPLLAGLDDQSAEDEGFVADAPRSPERFAWPLLRAVLLEQLDSQPPRQPFRRGGITFCGMVPARVIPFDIVAVLGLNEGVFPRSGGDSGLSLITEQPRSGDRDPRAEDRYLFLETLLSARTAMHLSYVGQDPSSDAQSNPAAPLAELIDHLQLETGCMDLKLEQAPWFVQHALQPFAARYFSSGSEDPRLFSFAGQYAVDSPGERLARPPFVSQDLPSGQADQPMTRPLAGLLRFLKQPSATALREQRQLSLEVLDTQLAPDQEPLDPSFAPLDVIDRKLFDRARRAGITELAEAAPAWLAASGAMPSGMAGERAWADSRDRVNAALALLVQEQPQLLGLRAVRRAVLVDLDPGASAEPSSLACWQAAAVDQGTSAGLQAGQPKVHSELPLSGSVLVLPSATGDVLLETRIGRKASLPHLLPLFAQYAALRLSAAAEQGAEHAEPRVLLLHGDKAAAWHPQVQHWMQLSDAALRSRLRVLVELCEASAQRPLLFFPRTIEAFSKASAGSQQSWYNARTVWRGGYNHTGEINYQPPYAELLARGRDFLDPHSPDSEEFAALAEQLAQVLGNPQPGERRT